MTFNGVLTVAFEVKVIIMKNHGNISWHMIIFGYILWNMEIFRDKTFRLLILVKGCGSVSCLINTEPLEQLRLQCTDSEGGGGAKFECMQFSKTSQPPSTHKIWPLPYWLCLADFVLANTFLSSTIYCITL